MTMPAPDAQTIVIILMIFLLAGLVKGVLGFGLPIITMSFLPFIVPVEQAIVLSAVVQPATNLFQLMSAGGVTGAVVVGWPVLVTLVPGVALGAWYLSSLDGNTLLLFVGVTIVLFSLINLLGYRIEISPRNRIPAGFGFGAVAGVVGALTSLNGWAFIMYLVGIGTDRQSFRSSIALLFLVSGFLISSSFWLVGLLDATLLMIGIATLGTAFPGMWLGDRVGSALPAELFRKIVLCALVLIGGMLILQSLSSS